MSVLPRASMSRRTDGAPLNTLDAASSSDSFASIQPPAGSLMLSATLSPSPPTASPLVPSSIQTFTSRLPDALQTQTTLRQQRHQIDTLKRDNDRLRTDLALETRAAAQANTVSHSAHIAKLQESHDLYALRIVRERAHSTHLDAEIAALQAEVQSIERAHGISSSSSIAATQSLGSSSQHSTTTARMAERSVRVLENRLDVALTKFNQALTHNKALRRQIDNLRRERTVFDGIYRKLERELHDKRADMTMLVADSNAANVRRDQAHLAIVELKKQNAQQIQQYEAQWSDLGNVVALERQTTRYRDQAELDKITGPHEVAGVSTEQRLTASVSRGAWSIAKDKAAIHLSMERVQSYEEAFARIQKYTRISDIDELVAVFVESEAHNFRLFNALGEAGAKVDRLKGQLKLVHTQLAGFRGNKEKNVEQDTDNQSDRERKNMLSHLALQLRQMANDQSEAEAAIARGQSRVHHLQEAMADMLRTLGIDASTAVSESSHSAASIVDSNAMALLGLAEQRTHELVQRFVKLSKDNAEQEQQPQPQLSPYSQQRSLQAPMGSEQNRNTTSRDGSAHSQLAAPTSGFGDHSNTGSGRPTSQQRSERPAMPVQRPIASTQQLHANQAPATSGQAAATRPDQDYDSETSSIADE